MARTYTLGTSDLAVSPIGLGCWQFSQQKGLVGGYWGSVDQETVNEIVTASIDGGVNWFDTAEVYGNGASEESLAMALTSRSVPRERYLIADKWFPAFRFARSVTTTFPKRTRALGGLAIDLHQIHQPFSFSKIEVQIARMAELLQNGDIRAVGVSNFSAEQMRRAHARLTLEGLPLASNQMRYSLIDREIERDGVLDAAAELGISIIAYSPLAQGILTGKFHAEESIQSRRGPRKWLKRFKREGLAATRPLVEELRAVAERHDATPAQVALAWATQYHGERIVAIPGASSPAQATANAGALAIELTREELDRLGDAGLQAEKRLKKDKAAGA
jgi:aryl-alcohol dehydrogenase-like predicted oxidoreductase